MKRENRLAAAAVGVAVALSLVAVSCGNGSGGFIPDPTVAQLEELALLDGVSESITCEPFPSTGQACGSGATASIGGSPQPTEVTLAVRLSDRSSVTCTPIEDGKHCVFQVVVDTAGFPEGSVFFATFLVRAPFSGSYTADPRPMDALAQAGQYGGIVKLDLPVGGAEKIVLGILSYVPPDVFDPHLIRRPQELLADYRATVVYTTSDLSVFTEG